MNTKIKPMAPLQPCPCGQCITDVVITPAGQGGKYMYVAGNCCGEWGIEFRSNYHAIDSYECRQLAITAWNNAPRNTEDE